MSLLPILSLPEFPFCIGVCSRPENPEPLPNTYPLKLNFNADLGRLELSSNCELEEILKTAYSLGISIGTPSDDTDCGRPYAADFLLFIEEVVSHKGRALEIGAGTGYLSRLLLNKGWRVDSLEPGKGYEHHWVKHSVKVINDFFPSPCAQGPYNMIVMYTVFEHIKDTTAFLRNVASHLAKDGLLVLSVPDCSLEIEAGDPSMLIHEHFQYFTAESLSRTIIAAGYAPIVSRSKFGRSLYACAKLGAAKRRPVVNDNEFSLFPGFGDKVRRNISHFQKNLSLYLTKGGVGIYCPGRALAFLPRARGVRFFDDDASLQGKYFPPFTARIEGRWELIKDPPESLFIMSRTFSAKLSAELAPLLPKTTILTPDEIVGVARTY